MNDRFGRSAAVSGSSVVIGAWLEDSDGTGVNGDQSNDRAQDTGAAYVFSELDGPFVTGVSPSAIEALIPGRTHRVVLSLSDLPSTGRLFSLALGNQFTSVFLGERRTIPASGWIEVQRAPS